MHIYETATLNSEYHSAKMDRRLRIPFKSQSVSRIVLYVFRIGVNQVWLIRACSSAWLERTPDKREVGSSSLPGPTIIYKYYLWGV